MVASSAVPSLLIHSICDIIEKFYSKYARDVDIVDYGGAQGDLVDGIMKNLNDSMTVNLKRIYGMSRQKEVSNQSILLFSNFKDLYYYNEKVSFSIGFIKLIRILVYCVNVTLSEISMLRTDLVIPPYYYFLVTGSNRTKIRLFTFENRNDLKICHENQTLIKANEFSSETLKWTVYPVFPRKYTSFHGCKMGIGVYPFTVFLLGHFYLMSENFTVFGPVNDLFQILAKKLHFSIEYLFCKSINCSVHSKKEMYLYNVIRITNWEWHADTTVTKYANHVDLNIESP